MLLPCATTAVAACLPTHCQTNTEWEASKVGSGGQNRTPHVERRSCSTQFDQGTEALACLRPRLQFLETCSGGRISGVVVVVGGGNIPATGTPFYLLSTNQNNSPIHEHSLAEGGPASTFARAHVVRRSSRSGLQTHGLRASPFLAWQSTRRAALHEPPACPPAKGGALPAARSGGPRPWQHT